ncbi:rhodanese-like domain-containing protein [Pseudomonadota bacterium]
MASQVLHIKDAAQLIEHDPHAVHAQLKAGEAVLVDVREVSEYENERIPGAFLMPLSFFEAEHFPYIGGSRVILMCAVGKRSAAAAKQLMNAGFGEVHHMKGGLTAWKNNGLETDED